MRLSRIEQEVVINFNLDEDTASIYTAWPKWINKLDRLCKANPAEFTCTAVNMCEGKVVSKEYTLPKRLVSIRTKTMSGKSGRNLRKLHDNFDTDDVQPDNLPPESLQTAESASEGV